MDTWLLGLASALAGLLAAVSSVTVYFMHRSARRVEDPPRNDLPWDAVTLLTDRVTTFMDEERRFRSDMQRMHYQLATLEDAVQQIRRDQLDFLRLAEAADETRVSAVQSYFAMALAQVQHADLEEMPALIYLGHGNGAGRVEAALVELLEAHGAAVQDATPVVKGSWFRGFRVKVAEAATSDTAKMIAEEVKRAIELEKLDKPQAEVDERKARAAASLVEAVQGQSQAVIMVGSFIVVKDEGRIAVWELTQRQITYLRQNPRLLRDGHELMMALEDHHDVGPAGVEPATPGL